MTTIELAGVTFNDYAQSGWVFSDLVDWYTIPDSKASADSIPQGHGSFDPGVDWRESAVPSFVAVYLGSSEADALAAVESLNALGTNAERLEMTVTDALRATTRLVSVQSVKVLDHKADHSIDVEIYLLAADPLRYGAEQTSTSGLPSLAGGLAFPIVFPIDFATTGEQGRVTLTNGGTQATWPSFTVRGGLSGGFSLRCIETGQEIRFQFPLSSADEVTVDARTGRAWINEEPNSVTGYLTVSDWWSVPAGQSRTVQFNGLGVSSGSPLLTGTIKPAYL